MISGRIGVGNAKGALDTIPAENISGTADASALSAQTFQPKMSKAFLLWLSLIVVVLLGLKLQMQTDLPSYNLFIEGGRASEGATVMVDGKPVGTMGAQDQPGVKSIGLRLHLGDGAHNIEVVKPGYLPVKQQVLLKGEDYVGIELQKSDQPPAGN